MGQFEVVFYETEDGEKPVQDFLDNSNVKMRNKMLMLMSVLQEKGNNLREPYSKHIDDGIFELRCKLGSDISRVLYFFYHKGKIVMTNAFIKKQQKTPKNEIALAKQYRKDYIERVGN